MISIHVIIFVPTTQIIQILFVLPFYSSKQTLYECSLFVVTESWCSKKSCYPASRQVPTPTNIPSTDSDENVPVPMSTVEETEWKDDTEVPLSSGLQDVSRLK